MPDPNDTFGLFKILGCVSDSLLDNITYCLFFWSLAYANPYTSYGCS